MKKIITLIAALAILGFTEAQDSTSVAEPEIDASKPTNFYTLLENTLEYTSNKSGGNLMGYRGKVLLAPYEEHLILGEVPLLYNDDTEKFGVGDIRARYFFLPYKNYDKFVGAFGPSVDVFVPTGSFKDGIGSGRWNVSPGFTVGLMAADWIQFFPIASYQYSSKNVTGDIPDAVNKEAHGMTFQVITPIVFSKEFFVQLTPIVRINDAGSNYIQEFFAAYSITPTVQLTGFYNGNFKDEVHQVSLDITTFL